MVVEFEVVLNEKVFEELSQVVVVRLSFELDLLAIVEILDELILESLAKSLSGGF